ncbi:MAG: M28 family peptidase, partial [Lachnospiraceae bacterium]|nr:M28 family peptidase [Lachnospiraceae bacterium]
ERLEAAGPLLYAEDGGPRALSMAKGCIVMLNQTVSSDLYRKLSEAGAVAYLTITGTPIDAGQDRLPARRRISRSEERTVPGATIHCQDASMLIEKMAADAPQKQSSLPGSSKKTRARLIVNGSIVQKSSQNVCASVSGKTDREGYVLLTAHYDSVPEGPGAYDNLAACGVLVELYRRLRLHPADREVRFAWLGSEEQGMLGSYAYVQRHESELLACLADINIDLAGQAIGSDVIGVTGSDSFVSEIRTFLEEYGSDAEVRQSVWSGDANTFAWKGVPALTYDRDGFGMHTCHDEQRFLSAWELGREADLIEAMVRNLAGREASASERELPEEMKQELKKLFLKY